MALTSMADMIQRGLGGKQVLPHLKSWIPDVHAQMHSEKRIRDGLRDWPIII